MDTTADQPTASTDDDQHCTPIDAAVEIERRRIARELHDGLAQDLTALSLAVRAARSPTEMAKVAELTERARDRVRRQMLLLHPPPMSREALTNALEALAARTTKEKNVTVTVEHDSLTLTPGTAGYDLLRVASESLHNAMHHGRAKHMRIALRDAHHRDEPSRQCIRLTIVDDGIGFDTSRAIPRLDGTGRGLGFMRERIAVSGGVFHVSSMPGQGTQVVVEVPAASIPVISDVWKMEVERSLEERGVELPPSPDEAS